MRILILLAAVVAAAVTGASAQSDYERLEGKAARFFDNGEWASANAMYLLMLEQQPRRVETYGNAVVADIMAGDTAQALDMVPRAMSYEVPLDTLLHHVRQTSFSIGRGDLYEHFLLDIKSSYPWLSRVADNYLMKYYAFRQNGPELIKYAETMLSGLPDNLSFLRMLAHGRMLVGDAKGAETAWLRAVALYPRDYDTVLDLANYFDVTGDHVAALRWMERAATLRSTPYVEARIAALSLPLTNKKHN